MVSTYPSELTGRGGRDQCMEITPCCILMQFVAPKNNTTQPYGCPPPILGHSPHFGLLGGATPTKSIKALTSPMSSLTGSSPPGSCSPSKRVNAACHFCDHAARRPGRNAVALQVACTAPGCRKVFCSRPSCRKKLPVELGLNSRDEFLTWKNAVDSGIINFTCQHCADQSTCPGPQCHKRWQKRVMRMHNSPVPPGVYQQQQQQQYQYHLQQPMQQQPVYNIPHPPPTLPSDHYATNLLLIAAKAASVEEPVLAQVLSDPYVAAPQGTFPFAGGDLSLSRRRVAASYREDPVMHEEFKMVDQHVSPPPPAPIRGIQGPGGFQVVAPMPIRLNQLPGLKFQASQPPAFGFPDGSHFDPSLKVDHSDVWKQVRS
jgi:hypothetical protein